MSVCMCVWESESQTICFSPRNMTIYGHKSWLPQLNTPALSFAPMRCKAGSERDGDRERRKRQRRRRRRQRSKNAVNWHSTFTSHFQSVHSVNFSQTVRSLSAQLATWVFSPWICLIEQKGKVSLAYFALLVVNLAKSAIFLKFFFNSSFHLSLVSRHFKGAYTHTQRAF